MDQPPPPLAGNFLHPPPPFRPPTMMQPPPMHSFVTPPPVTASSTAQPPPNYQYYTPPGYSAAAPPVYSYPPTPGYPSHAMAPYHHYSPMMVSPYAQGVPPTQVTSSVVSVPSYLSETPSQSSSQSNHPTYSKELDLLLPRRKSSETRHRHRHSPSPSRRRRSGSRSRRSRSRSRDRRRSPSDRYRRHRRSSRDRERDEIRDRHLRERDMHRNNDHSQRSISNHSRPSFSRSSSVSTASNRTESRELHAPKLEAKTEPIASRSSELEVKTEPTISDSDRPSSPHSSTHSGPEQPLSPARGPSRRPPSPSSTTLVATGNAPASIHEVIDNSVSSAVRQSNEAELKRLGMSLNEVITEELKVWTRSAPADLYYERDMTNPIVMKATPRLTKLLDRFEEEIVSKAENIRAKLQAEYKPPKPAALIHRNGCCSKNHHGGDEDSSSSSDDDDDDNGNDIDEKESVRNEALDWMTHRSKQRFRLSEELWDNRPQELNDGPVCRCSLRARKFGIRHGIYPGEDKHLPDLSMDTNNAGKLYHYRVTISPPTNFLVKPPTVIYHDQHEFIFEGFSMFTTEPLKELPVCNVVRFSIQYSILYFEEKYPDNVTLRELKLFQRHFFHNILELNDWEMRDQYFFMPRFVRDLSENGKEILSMNEVISYLIKSYQPIIDEMELLQMLNLPRQEWQNGVAQKVKGMLVTNPTMSPSTIRADQLDREQDNPDVIKFPDIVHFGTRPQQLCYAGNSDYQRTWREYVKYRHLLANMAKPTFRDKRQLEEMEERLSTMRANNTMKRDVVIAVSSQGFYKTGLMCDIVQHGLLLPCLVHHLRMHAALDHFEQKIEYTFKNRSLLQLAMTHPSYKENFGTNPDHVRNTLSNCGIRQPEYGDKRAHAASTRKRGINMLISIMSRFGKTCETESKVGHNERLEFLGDAVVEFVTSVHLFHMFPDLEEGGLATYRAALVQNQHLAQLAEALGLEHYMLYAHGSDLCHDAEMRHAMANCFEALMGAIYLDSGINEADRVFAKALFGTDQELHEVWTNLNPHPLQMQEPDGDRHWISSYPVLQKIVEFEKNVGIEFSHVRLLARAFSDRSVGNSNLTMGSNQRLEFLGDTVLQLVTSDYLYRHFPEHHEGHLSLLRSSMVNNRTQAVVCDDLDLPRYAMIAKPKKEFKMKDRADLLEAFLGALYVDKDLEYCRVFAEVCFFPRLQQFIINQEWNDPKSKLQQCCLTLRSMNGQDPDIPVYKVIEVKGPTNTRVFSVAVYFRGQRLAKAEGHSIQQAEMSAAKLALDSCGYLFPHLNYQRKIVEKSLKQQTKVDLKQAWLNEVEAERKRLGLDEINAQCQLRNAERMAKAKRTSATDNSQVKQDSDTKATKSHSLTPQRSSSHLDQRRSGSLSRHHPAHSHTNKSHRISTDTNRSKHRLLLNRDYEPISPSPPRSTPPPSSSGQTRSPPPRTRSPPPRTRSPPARMRLMPGSHSPNHRGTVVRRSKSSGRHKVEKDFSSKPSSSQKEILQPSNHPVDKTESPVSTSTSDSVEQMSLSTSFDSTLVTPKRDPGEPLEEGECSDDDE